MPDEARQVNDATDRHCGSDGFGQKTDEEPTNNQDVRVPLGRLIDSANHGHDPGSDRFGERVPPLDQQRQIGRFPLQKHSGLAAWAI